MKSYLRLSLLLVYALVPLMMGAASPDIAGGGCGNKTSSPTPSPVATLTAIAITPTSASLNIGDTQQLTAIGTYSDASTADITSSVTWSSSNTSAVTVSAAGLASGVATGVSNVSASLDSITSNSVPVAVDTSLVSIAITPTSASLNIGDTQQFAAIGTYADSSTADLTSAVTWNSSNTSIATISATGLASSLSVGLSNITASLDSITSNSAPLSIDNPLVSIVITPSTPTLGLSMTQQFTALGTYFDSSTADVTSAVTWHSSSTSTATLSATGLATTLAAGSTDVSADLDSITSNTASLVVKQAYLYVTNSGNATVSICPINADSSLGTCSASTADDGSGPTLSDPKGTAISPDGTIAFVANHGNSTVSICPVNSDGSFGTCSFTNQSGAFPGPWGISLNRAGTLLYVPYGNNFSICEVGVGGALSNCHIDTDLGESLFATPKGVQFSIDGNFAYVANVDHFLTTCSVKVNGGFENCIKTDDWDTPFGGGSLNIEGTFFYAGNYADPSGLPAISPFVTKCSVAEDGSLTSCENTADSFTSDTFNFAAFSGIILSASFGNSHIYIPNCGGNNLSICSLDSETGIISNCDINTGNGTYNTPTSIAISFTQ